MDDLIVPILFTLGSFFLAAGNVIWLGRVAGWWA
jgi:hypothetical protein